MNNTMTNHAIIQWLVILLIVMLLIAMIMIILLIIIRSLCYGRLSLCRGMVVLHSGKSTPGLSYLHGAKSPSGKGIIIKNDSLQYDSPQHSYTQFNNWCSLSDCPHFVRFSDDDTPQPSLYVGALLLTLMFNDVGVYQHLHTYNAISYHTIQW